MRTFHFSLIVFVLVIFNASAATEIKGSVSAKQDNLLEVTFEPHDTAKPAIGDTVSFSKKIPGTGGLTARAGDGTVTEIKENIVWVKTKDNRPGPKMDAVIYATGIKSQKKPSQTLTKMDDAHLKKAVIKELIRLRLIDEDTDETISEIDLSPVIEMFGMINGYSFPKGKLSPELLKALKIANP